MISIYDSLPNVQGTGEILQDGTNDWRGTKLKSIAISKAMTKETLLKRSQRMFDCGNYLKFASDIAGNMKLYRASFCKDRMCSACQKRRSLMIFHQVKQVCNAIKIDFPTYRYLLLTLTVPNVNADRLGDEISHMAASWRRLAKRKEFSVVKGWFRALEVTYNGDRDDYHPHYHVLVCVPSNYFAKAYIKQDRWLELWQEATKYPHITQVDVRAIKPNPKRQNSDDISSAAAEVGKYATKPSNYVVKAPDGNYYAFPKVVEQLAFSIRGRKLVAFGGLMLEYSKKLDLADVESDSVDLINIGEDSTEIAAVMVKIFHWNVGLRNYVN